MKNAILASVASLLVIGLLLPSIVPTPVAAEPTVPSRTHLIKAIYIGVRTLINKNYVWEFYYSPETKDFHFWRGPFQRYESYEHQLGYRGPLFLFYICF